MSDPIDDDQRRPKPGIGVGAKAIGKTIGGRYQITGSLGEGGMGLVFAGHDAALDRAIAIKLLTRPTSKDSRATQRLLKEARAMARVVNAATVQVFDSGIDADHGAYLVMERLDGEDLSRFLHDHGPLAQELALALLQQLCEAVRAVHEMGIVHRDLKPSNVFVLRHPPGTVPRIKLLDFGIAQLNDDDDQLTRPGDVLGTLVYMAPERWQSDAVVDRRTDVYALGVILYEMLTGQPPFRAETRAALRLAVLNDAAEPMHRVRPEIPRWLVEATERAMDRSPDRRYADVSTFARALGLSLSPTAGAPDAATLGGDFRGTARYHVLRRLAQAPNAAVYAALDSETNHAVALKRLRIPSGEAAFRLKREFLTASEICHPNLVRLHALWEEQGALCLSMELVEGVPLLEHVAGAGPGSIGRLRSCLAQLVRGLHALHARGLAHGDVKPDNALVELAGRLVLLDCGFASRWGTRDGARATTPYAAPETVAGRIGAEADFYAVGVILHQALTGRLPARASPGAAFRITSFSGSPEATVTASVTDGGLFDLCERLLAVEPGDRPRADQILAALGPGEEAAAEVSSATRAAFDSARLIGRGDTLETLHQAVNDLAVGGPRLILIEGSSGIGKTALLDHFRRQLAAQGRALVLAGRARAGESVPFPALDEAIDDLGSFLLRLTPAATDALLPRRSGRLAQLFPTLARVPAIARASNALEPVADPSQVRRQASDALRELLGRLSDRQAVVLVIDDLQWIDPDSGALLAHLLGGHDPPPVLVVCATRPNGHETSPDLQKLQAGLRRPLLRIELAALGHDEAFTLVRARWRGDQPLDTETTERLVSQSGGVPFFAELLASGFSQGSGPGLGAGPGPGSGGLEDILLQRARALPAEARNALELLCISSRPLPAELVLDAVGARSASALDPLLASSWVRSTRVGRGWALEPYHDKISELIRSAVSLLDRQAHHRRLVKKLQSDPETDPEMLVEHLAGCGDVDGASTVALTAAGLANGQLAFDRAAALFAMALSHGKRSDQERSALFRQQARALQDAGRRKAAGEMLLRAAATFPDGTLARALRQEAGTHLLLSGDIKRGLEFLSPALKQAGLEVPADFAETVQATTALLGALGSRGLERGPSGSAGLPGSAEASRSPQILERVDLCLILAQGLAHIDLRVLPFACQALLAALDAGEPGRLQRACALFVINFVEYLPNPLIAPTLALCRSLTNDSPDPYARALLDAALAENAHFEGDFLAAEAAFERAERTLLESCPRATRELATVRDIAVFIQYAQKGDFKTQLDRTQRWLAQADVSGDLFHASMLRVAHAIVWIAQDQPQRAHDELQRAQAEWTGAAGVLEVAAALYHDIIARYEERDLKQVGASPMRSSLLRSPAAQTPFLRGYLGLQEAWAALRAIADRRAGVDQVSHIHGIIAGLRQLGLPIWSAVSDALESNLDYLVGEQDRALRGLDDSEQKFRRLHMLCLAACARKRRGQFVGGEMGARLEAEADTELTALGVAKPDRWTRAYWSMFDVARAKLRTQTGDETGQETSEPEETRAPGLSR